MAINHLYCDHATTPKGRRECRAKLAARGMWGSLTDTATIAVYDRQVRQHELHTTLHVHGFDCADHAVMAVAENAEEPDTMIELKDAQLVENAMDLLDQVCQCDYWKYV